MPLSCTRSRRAGRGLLALWILGLGASPASAAAITGVCPDGSIYIVQRRAQVPCRDSREVEPHEVPPLRPEYLPSPYTWQVWSQAHNPNNPYNLIDATRKIRALQGGSPGPPEAGAPEPQPAPGTAAGEAAPVAGREAEPAPVAPLELGFTDQELRDLYAIIELSQQAAPATLARKTADGRGRFRVSLAHSAAFEQRLRQAWASRGGLGERPVLLFSAAARDAEEFWANFTFVQGHLTFQPEAADARQLGILQGHLGRLAAGEVVLGYVVLPEALSLSEDLDVYWNDRRTTTHFGS